MSELHIIEGIDWRGFQLWRFTGNRCQQLAYAEPQEDGRWYVTRTGSHGKSLDGGAYVDDEAAARAWLKAVITAMVKNDFLTCRKSGDEFICPICREELTEESRRPHRAPPHGCQDLRECPRCGIGICCEWGKPTMTHKPVTKQRPARLRF